MSTTNNNRKHRNLLIRYQQNKCCYCECQMLPANTRLGVGFHPRGATVEHLRRKSDGGSNSIQNKAVACYECNSGRGSIDWLTYKSLKMGELAAQY